MSLKIGFGAAVRQERSALGISQGELAKRSGLHRTYVSDLERGARNPSIESIEKLAQALDVSVAKLFEQAGRGASE
jgi:transcriptional regulator with XRE-family HTH domain